MPSETKDAWRDRREAELQRKYEDRIEDRRARSSAGMGFWRLAFVVAVGILLANVISSAVKVVFTYLTHPPQ